MSEYANNPIDNDETPFLNPDDMLNYMYTFGISGNIICPTWQKIIRWKFGKRTPNGKPHLEAIILLSEIFYWYRPKVEKDVEGNIKLFKRFSADILQLSYSDIEKNLGQTKEEASSALKTLENLKIVKREFRTIASGGIKIPNVMHIRFFPQNLKELVNSFLKANLEDAEPEKLKKFIPSPVQTGNPPRFKPVIPPPSIGVTNTENTTKTSTEKTTTQATPAPDVSPSAQRVVVPFCEKRKEALIANGLSDSEAIKLARRFKEMSESEFTTALGAFAKYAETVSIASPIATITKAISEKWTTPDEAIEKEQAAQATRKASNEQLGYWLYQNRFESKIADIMSVDGASDEYLGIHKKSEQFPVRVRYSDSRFIEFFKDILKTAGMDCPLMA